METSGHQLNSSRDYRRDWPENLLLQEYERLCTELGKTSLSTEQVSDRVTTRSLQTIEWYWLSELLIAHVAEEIRNGEPPSLELEQLATPDNLSNYLRAQRQLE